MDVHHFGNSNSGQLPYRRAREGWELEDFSPRADVIFAAGRTFRALMLMMLRKDPCPIRWCYQH